ncbi:hypothetical protein [Staphylococcus epidermidis]|nr:hypothetical protein [Staphylococcus epidermidis]
MKLVRLNDNKELNLRRKKTSLFEVPQTHPRGDSLVRSILWKTDQSLLI